MITSSGTSSTATSTAISTAVSSTAGSSTPTVASASLTTAIDASVESALARALGDHSRTASSPSHSAVTSSSVTTTPPTSAALADTGRSSSVPLISTTVAGLPTPAVTLPLTPATLPEFRREPLGVIVSPSLPPVPGTLSFMMTSLNDAVRFLQGLRGDCVKDSSLLSQIEQKVKEIDSLCLQTAYKDEARQLLSECSKALTKVLQILNDGYRPECGPALLALRITCASLSDHFKEFCEELCKFGFETFLILLIRSSKTTQPLPLADEWMIFNGLYILVNCVQQVSSPVLNVTFWKMRPFDIVLPCARSQHHLQISVLSLILLGAMCWDADHCLVSLEKKDVEVLVKLTKSGNFFIKTEYNSFTYTNTISASKVLNGVKGLAISELNAKCFVDCGIVPYLFKFLKSDNPDCRLAAAQIIWMLSMHLTDKDQLPIIEALVPAECALQCALQKMKGIVDITKYLKCAYNERRFKECISEFKRWQQNNKCTDEIKLLYGKSLYCSYVNTLKYAKIGLPHHEREKRCNDVKEAIKELGGLFDKGLLDEEGCMFLDLAMVEIVKEIDGLGTLKRCLLCRSKKKLKRSHVIPKCILEKFTECLEKKAPSKKYYVCYNRQKLMSPGDMTWWMFCNDCENILSKEENEFFKEIFCKTYDEPETYQEIDYSYHLYLFAAGLLFRCMVINPKGISGFLNDDKIYKVFQTLREIVTNSAVNDQKISIYINPFSVKEEENATWLNAILNMPVLMLLAETIPYFLAHFGIINFVVNFSDEEFCPPSFIDASGKLRIPAERERMDSLPLCIQENLRFYAQKLEKLEIEIPQKIVDEMEKYNSAQSLSEAYYIIEPSKDPKSPKRVNFLPPDILVESGGMAVNLPSGHKHIFNITASDSARTEGVTYFLCVGANEGYFNKPYIIVHIFKPGLCYDYGFFISPESLCPEGPLPDKNPKYGAKKSLENQEMIKHFWDCLKKKDINLHEILRDTI